LLEIEPAFVDPMGNDPEFKAVVEELKEKFWANNKRIRSVMAAKGLL
jgi:hypothetical protein